jgi:hypothetical protein
LARNRRISVRLVLGWSVHRPEVVNSTRMCIRAGTAKAFNWGETAQSAIDDWSVLVMLPCVSATFGMSCTAPGSGLKLLSFSLSSITGRFARRRVFGIRISRRLLLQSIAIAPRICICNQLQPYPSSWSQGRYRWQNDSEYIRTGFVFSARWAGIKPIL